MHQEDEDSTSTESISALTKALQLSDSAEAEQVGSILKVVDVGNEDVMMMVMMKDEDVMNDGDDKERR